MSATQESLLTKKAIVFVLRAGSHGFTNHEKFVIFQPVRCQSAGTQGFLDIHIQSFSSIWLVWEKTREADLINILSRLEPVLRFRMFHTRVNEALSMSCMSLVTKNCLECQQLRISAPGNRNLLKSVRKCESSLYIKVSAKGSL